jgi:hypothetical protein
MPGSLIGSLVTTVVVNAAALVAAAHNAAPIEATHTARQDRLPRSLNAFPMLSPYRWRFSSDGEYPRGQYPLGRSSKPPWPIV